MEENTENNRYAVEWSYGQGVNDLTVRIWTAKQLSDKFRNKLIELVKEDLKEK